MSERSGQPLTLHIWTPKGSTSMDEQKFTCAICREPVQLGGEPDRPEWRHEDGTPLCGGAVPIED